MFKPSSTKKATTYLLDNSKHMFDSNGLPIDLSGKLGSKGKATRLGHFITALDGDKPKITLKTKPQVKHIDFKDFPIV